MSTLIPALALAAVLVAVNFAWFRPRALPAFLLIGGLLHFGGGPRIAGLELSAWWLAVMIAMAGVTLLRMPQPAVRPACAATAGRRAHRALSGVEGPALSFGAAGDLPFTARLSSPKSAGRGPFELSWPERLYALFLCWCLLQVLRAESTYFAARVYLKLLFPFLVMMLARRAMLSRARFGTALKWVLGASFVASLLVGGFTQRFLPSLCWGFGARLLWAGASFADHAAVAGVLALVAWRLFDRPRYMALGVWLGLSSVLAGIRTGIAAFAVGASVFALMTFRRTTAIPALVGIYLLAAASLFALPGMKERMFYDAEAVDSRGVILRPYSLAADELDASGRFAMWETVLERFFNPSPLTGSGLGATQAWFYSGAYGEVRVEHSSYVRLLCDTGLVGLSLFLLTMVSCMLTAWRVRRESAAPEARLCALGVLCTFPVLMVCMGFDNLLNYVLPATQHPFAFTGILLGLEERTAADGGVPLRLTPPGAACLRRDDRRGRQAAAPPGAQLPEAPSG
jgi:O-antigen ligase